MIHLFKKVYVAVDETVDVNFDRVVISKDLAGNLIHGAEPLVNGNVVHACTTVDDLIPEVYATWIDFFNALNDYCTNTNKRVMLYLDDESLTKVLVAWYKLILKNPNKESVKDLIKCHAFKFNTFHRSRYSSNENPVITKEVFTLDAIDDIFENMSDFNNDVKDTFIDLYKSSVGVEHLLASYLCDSSYASELKETIKILIKKDLEKYFYELKEIFFVHLLTKRFTDLLGLNKAYDMTNINDIYNDTSKYAQLFTKASIWNSPYMAMPSTNGNINWNNITEEDINDIKEFTRLSGSCWNEETVYERIKSDMSKLDFISLTTDKKFTTDKLNTLIETEKTYEHAAGSFFSIDLETVNHYVIQNLLDAHGDNNKDFLQKYALK